MSPSTRPSITLSDVGLTWPDGTTALAGITATFGAGRTGLVGLNGSGKSTLLRLIAGELRPSTGRITTSAAVAHLRQTLPLQVDATVADLLRVGHQVRALRAIEAGDASAHHFDVLGDHWDVESRAAEALRDAGLPSVELDRRVAELSGGEALLVAIAGLRLRAAPIVLLDEPTNNLDRAARAGLAELVHGWTGTLVVVSHDPALLELMDDTAELHDGRLTVFGGPYRAWREHLEEAQAAAARAERAAEQVVRTEQRQRVEAETKLARRARYARTDFANKRRPKIVMQQRKTEAQVSAGKLRTEFDGKVQAARAALWAASARVRDDAQIRIDLPDPDVPAGRRIAELHGTNRSFLIQGPQRVALIGPNGAGKTTLLEGLVHPETARTGPARASRWTTRIGYLPQRLDGLDDAGSVLDNVRAWAPGSPPQLIRHQLARFLLHGDAVDRAVGTLSGGERFRVALARLLLASPPPQLLVLDEPSNNLDTRSVDHLVHALRGYRGALLVVSHDDSLLARLDLTTALTLDRSGNLSAVQPTP
jgi:ATPase subunit of ABC transporter with duplicated ATPase domains